MVNRAARVTTRKGDAMSIASKGRPLLFRTAACVGLALAIGGCADANMDDLQSYAASVRNRPPGHIAPLPEFKTYESYVYKPDGLRDPFEPKEEPVIQAQTGNKEPTTPPPDANRNKEALEKFPLDTIKFVGLLEKGDQRWAVVKGPDELVYRVQPGNHMGQNYGKVTAVSENKISLVETVPDGQGRWVQREVAIAISE